MHVAWCTILFILGLANGSIALRSGKWCPRACDLTLGYATFNDTDPWLSRKVRQCRSHLRITSLYLCFDEFCNLNDGEVRKRIAEDSEWCDEHAGVTLPPFHDVVDRWTSEDRAKLPRHSVEKAVQWPVLNTSVLPEKDFFERAFTTLVGSTHSYRLCIALIGSGCCVLRVWYPPSIWLVHVLFLDRCHHVWSWHSSCCYDQQHQESRLPGCGERRICCTKVRTRTFKLTTCLAKKVHHRTSSIWRPVFTATWLVHDTTSSANTHHCRFHRSPCRPELRKLSTYRRQSLLAEEVRSTTALCLRPD